MNNNEKIANALRCMAVGDAVGYDFEFKFRSQFSKGEIIDRANYGDLTISDDTQMTLFGFESIIEKKPVQKSYLDWYRTQTNRYRSVYDGLLSFKEMWQEREGGGTCLRSLKELKLYGFREPNESSGCGAIMRLLPAMYESTGINWVVDSIQVTHDHPECLTAANVLLRAYNGVFEQQQATDIKELGEGWTSMECVNMAIWAVQNSKTFDELLVNSIWHSGDSDSVAAVACSIWGYLGNECKYYDKIIEQEPIEYIISKL